MNTSNPTIGVYDFETIATKGYYVDKTEVFQYIYNLEDAGVVILFTRPRRFGKSLMLSAIDTFFNVKKGDKGHLFKGLKAEKLPCFESRNSLPVIHLDFKDCARETSEECLEATIRVIRNAYDTFPEVKGSVGLTKEEEEVFRKVKANEASMVDYASALYVLTKAVYNELGKKPLLLIDEYDAQMNEAYQRGFLDQIKGFFKPFLGKSLKGNTYIRAGIVTGVLPFASESLSSGWNSNCLDNGVYSVFPSECFAFTEDDVDKMMKDYHCAVPKDKIREWYGGYRYNGASCYSPWSLINFFAFGQRFGLYWNLTGSTAIIEDMYSSHQGDLKEDIQSLYLGNNAVADIDFSFSYHDIKRVPSAAYIFLFSSGYLTAKDSETEGKILLSIPNTEVKSTFQKQILSFYERKGAKIRNLSKLLQALQEEDSLPVESFFQELLYSMAFTEYSDWKVYQSLTAFVCSLLFEGYLVDQEVSTGDGKSDIFIEPKNNTEEGWIVEVKSISFRTSEARLQTLSSSCIKQIEDRRYIERMKRKGIKRVHLIGVAFAQKRCRVSFKTIVTSEH